MVKLPFLLNLIFSFFHYYIFLSNKELIPTEYLKG